MRRILFISLAATGLVGAWSSCFVAKGKEATTTGTTTTSGTGGAGGTGPTTTSSRATTTTSGAGGFGQGGFGQGGFGVGGFGGVPAIDVVCNPVTNANCSGGDACGPTVNGGLTGFACFPGPTAIKACGDCDLCLPAPCAPGFICLPTNADDTTAQCARYCCSDADCGALGLCSVNNSNGVPLFGAVSTTLGVCVSKLGLLDAGAGIEDAGDAGDAGSTRDAGVVSPFACDPPATAPSAGSCVMLTL